MKYVIVSQTGEMISKEIHLSDDYLFSRVMGDPKICKIVMDILLPGQIDNIVKITTQNDIRDKLEKKEVILDVFIEDRSGRTFDIEMQNTKHELMNRVEYYQAMILANKLNKGNSYKDLKSNTVVFICGFDPLDKEMYRYSSRSYKLEEKIDLSPKTNFQWTFYNLKGKHGSVSPIQKELLYYINGHTTDEFMRHTKFESIKTIHDKVKEILVDEVFRRDKMALNFILEDQFDEGEKKGKREGKREGISIAKNVIQLFKEGHKIFDIAKICKINEKEVEEIIEALK